MLRWLLRKLREDQAIKAFKERQASKQRQLLELDATIQKAFNRFL